MKLVWAGSAAAYWYHCWYGPMSASKRGRCQVTGNASFATPSRMRRARVEVDVPASLLRQHFPFLVRKGTGAQRAATWRAVAHQASSADASVGGDGGGWGEPSVPAWRWGTCRCPWLLAGYALRARMYRVMFSCVLAHCRPPAP